MKKMVSLILSIMMAMALFPVAPKAAQTQAAVTQNAVTVANAEQLQAAIDEGAAEIRITSDLELAKPIFVHNSTWIYGDSAVTITRAADFTGDMFVVGEQEDGTDAVIKNAVTFTLGKSDQAETDQLVIDGKATAANGTAIYVAHSSTVNLNKDVTIQNCYKTGNQRVTEDDLSKGTLVGGAAMIIASGAVNVYGASIRNNTVADKADADSSLGGAVYNYGNFKMFAGTISGNKADKGGAIYNYRTVKLYAGEISGNTATTYGGAINQADSQYAKTVFGNHDASDTVTLKNNSAQTGGAFYSTKANANARAMSALMIYDDVDAVFEENKATNNGGAIYTYGIVNIKKATFTGNQADEGGAVNLQNGNCTQIISGCTFEDNTSDTHGGAAYVNAAQPVFSDCSFLENKASSNGGALYVYKTAAGTSVRLRDVTFDRNEAGINDKGGGAIYASGGILDINGADFIKNEAMGITGSGYGGAIGAYSTSTITVNDARFNENKSNYRGGALYNSGSQVKFFNSNFYKNESVDHGGAIATLSSGSTKAYDCTFTENSSGGNGGAVYSYDSGSTPAEQTYQDCTFDANHGNVSSGYGGALYGYGAANVVNVYNCILTNNAAKEGGAIYITKTGMTFNVNGVKVAGNTGTGAVVRGNAAGAFLNINPANYVCTGSEDGNDYASIATNKGKLTINEIESAIPEKEVYPREKADDDESGLAAETVEDLITLMTKSEIPTDSGYNPGAALANSSNFQSRNTASYQVNNTNVTTDTFVYQPGIAAGNPNVGEAILIFEAMLDKQANPGKYVDINLSSYRFSPEAAVCLNRNSTQFGYMRKLADKEYDEFGYVRISYLLVSAAKMGIRVHVVAQINAVGDTVPVKDYFAGHRNDICDSAYVADQKVSDYLDFDCVNWDFENKDATDLMHTKACAVSSYLDMDGNEHEGTVWLSSANLDNIGENGLNGWDALQTGIIISDHNDLYRVTRNYLDLIGAYTGKDEVQGFRNAVQRKATAQIDVLKAGGTVAEEDQIVYIGTDKDPVFELYFSAVGGDDSKWDETYNTFNKQLRELGNSDDYIWLGINNPKYDDFNMGTSMQNVIANAFNTKKNAENRINVNIYENNGFNTAAYDGLTVGSDLAVKSLATNDYTPIHSKDMLLSYSKDGVRYYVTLISSMNLHEGAASYQSNFALVVKENTCNAGSVFRTIAEHAFKDFLGEDISEDESFSVAFTEEETAYVYTAEAIKPAVTVSYGGNTLTEGTDYTVKYNNNVNVGTAKARVAGLGKYSFSQELTFTITPASMDDVEAADIEAQPYTGSAIEPVLALSFNGAELTKDVDYEVTYEDNIAITAAAKVTVTGKGNYTGTKELTFVIASDIAEVEIAPISEQPYTGEEIKPLVTVTADGKTLEDGKDYTVAYSDNINAGTASVTVTGMGEYMGTKTATFTIAPKNIEDAKLSKASFTYNGKAQTPVVTVTGLTKGIDFNTAYYTDAECTNAVEKENVKNAGTYYVKITGINNYTGSVAVKFTIAKAAMTVSGVKTYYYNGKVYTPSVTVKAGSTTLASAVRASKTVSNKVKITFPSGRKAVKTYTITVTPLGTYAKNYKTTKKQFSIKVKPTTLYTPKAFTKSFKARWKKLAKAYASGYQIRYSLKSTLKSAKTKNVNKYSLSAATVKKLKAKKTYYMQIRTVKKIGTKKYYSAWSKTKKVVTK